MLTPGFGQLDDTTIPVVLADGPQLTLAPEPTSAGQARAFVRQHTCEADESLRESAELLVSELVTNGVVHAGTPMTLGVVHRDHAVLIGVSDRGAGLPRERVPSLSAEGGRGISLVATIARYWGVAVRDSGKIIWCLIDTEPHGAT